MTEDELRLFELRKRWRGWMIGGKGYDWREGMMDLDGEGGGSKRKCVFIFIFSLGRKDKNLKDLDFWW